MKRETADETLRRGAKMPPRAVGVILLEGGSQGCHVRGSSNPPRSQAPSFGEPASSNERHRSTLKVFLDILEVVRDERAARRTRIMRVANVSSGRLETYLGELVSLGLLKESARSYALTVKGLDFVIQMKDAEAYVAAFGLGI